MTTPLSCKTRVAFSPIVWVSQFLVIAFASTAYSTPIDLLSAQYTTIVSLDSFVSGTSFCRTQVSLVPISDALYYSDGRVIANANAGVMGMSAHTSAFPAPPDFIHGAYAFTESDLWFSPVTSQTTTIGIQFSAGPHITFTYGYVSLLDVTSGIKLWNYGWDLGNPGAQHDWTPVPWVLTGDSGTAVLMLDTTLNASDTYQLSMSTSSGAASDSETESIQLFGLEPVPEPSTFALLGLGSITAAMVRLYGRAHKPRHCAKIISGVNAGWRPILHLS